PPVPRAERTQAPSRVQSRRYSSSSASALTSTNAGTTGVPADSRGDSRLRLLSLTPSATSLFEPPAALSFHSAFSLRHVGSLRCLTGCGLSLARNRHRLLQATRLRIVTYVFRGFLLGIDMPPTPVR